MKYLAALAALLLVAVAPAVAAPESISLAYGFANDYLPAYVAKEQGFFAKQNLDVTFQVQRVISTIPVALSSGAVEIGTISPTMLLQAREGGVDLVVVAGASRHERKSPTIGLLAPEGTVKTAEDLRGKKIGVPGLYGGLDVTLREWLDAHRVPPSSVTFVEVPLPQMGELLARKQVDAVAAIEPVRSRILAAGGVTDLNYVGELRDDVNLVFYAAARPWATAHRDTLQRFRAALAEGVAYVASHPDRAHEIEQKYLGYTGRSATYSTTVTADDLLFYGNAMRSLGILKKPVGDVNALLLK